MATRLDHLKNYFERIDPMELISFDYKYIFVIPINLKYLPNFEEIYFIGLTPGHENYFINPIRLISYIVSIWGDSF